MYLNPPIFNSSAKSNWIIFVNEEVVVFAYGEEPISGGLFRNTRQSIRWKDLMRLKHANLAENWTEKMRWTRETR